MATARICLAWVSHCVSRREFYHGRLNILFGAIVMFSAGACLGCITDKLNPFNLQVGVLGDSKMHVGYGKCRITLICAYETNKHIVIIEVLCASF